MRKPGDVCITSQYFELAAMHSRQSAVFNRKLKVMGDIRTAERVERLGLHVRGLTGDQN